MDNFARRYKKLNKNQRLAVDAIDGPVMVVAGPGTGKTELLSMRVANILQKTDTSAQNILCLTFTESGANAMRERLIELMGKEAYGVSVHTFHSFGSEIINRYGDYFYSGAHFHPADELSSYNVLHSIFEKLPHDNPLGSKMNGEYTQLRSVQNTISDFKKSGLTPDEIQRLLKNNTLFLDFAEPLLQKIFANRISKKTIAEIEQIVPKLKAHKEEALDLPNLINLSSVCIEQLERIVERAQNENNTKPITEWKNAWLEKNSTNDFVFKDRKRTKKLFAASFIYGDYLRAMQENALYDYDDMILRVAHALEVFDDLRFNLQEQYQYILVDEFQDTNGAQMRILSDLTNNELYGGKPNILVVGDDDQAIYSFQGAEVGNIISFKDQFPALKTITLTENYRSSAEILSRSREVITQGDNRLENYIESIDKTLVAKNDHVRSSATLVEYETQNDELYSLAHEIKTRIKNGQKPSSIAVLARSHKDIQLLLPYFKHEGIAMHYEHKDNILQQPPILLLIELAKILHLIASGRTDIANAALPELLAHPAWEISPETLWKLSLRAHREKRFWLEIMLEEDNKLKNIAEWLITMARDSQHQPLDVSLDILLGNSTKEASFTAPFMHYFFSEQTLNKQPDAYLSHLRALQLLRQKLAEYMPEKTLHVKDFVEFITMHEKANLPINAETDPSNDRLCAVNIMTAHKAKGQEFESVFIVNATDTTWGTKSRGRSQRLSYPANLPIAPAGESADERLRLFFVALTRAKRELVISYSLKNVAEKQTILANFLHIENLKPQTVEAKPLKTQIKAATYAWQDSILNSDNLSFKELMKSHLAHYQLSPTHLNNFIDIVDCGPQAFFMQNILKFPQAAHPSAAFGSAIHKTLQKAHHHLSSTKQRRPTEDVLHDFEVFLSEQRLEPSNFEYYLQKGSDTLQAYLNNRYESFTPDQKVESNFSGQNAVINSIHLTGAIDVMSVNNKDKTISIIDYKTGKPALGWKGRDDYEKIKLHRYKQQLLFYKLMVEHSQQYSGYVVRNAALEFVEPEKDTEQIHQLAIEYDQKELDEFIKLLAAVWQKIKEADMPSVAKYDKNYKGILQFEDDLKKGLI